VGRRLTQVLVPVYRTSARVQPTWSGHQDDYVVAVLLPTKAPPERWIQRNVALLCQLT
jgi:hypothetical protein